MSFTINPLAERGLRVKVQLSDLIPSAVKGPFGNADLLRDRFDRDIHKTHVVNACEGQVVFNGRCGPASFPAAAGSFPFCRPVFSRENGRNIRRRLFICFFHQAFRDRDAHYGGSFVPGKVKENAGGMQAVLQFKEFLFIKRLVRG